MAQLNEDLAFEVLAVVSEIPRGKVATYGQIARLIGQPNQARLVGKILSRAEYFGDYPCHRVVNQAGRLVPGWADQAWLLQAEGIPFKKKGYVDMAAAQWED
ncbi:MGMT family protein [Eremococcus coleocola]|uniref:MGMT family protein n=1 Tax=Eremococcus coleocola TaxID=88132 RepID=UPI0004231C91|nr:methylated-DNA--[protein]-cysteine S-methyltransferase [Eremococcus coleocola]